MIKYNILQSESLDTLINIINSYIIKGWKPLGGLATASKGSYGTYYLQAIVKEDIGTRG